MEAHLEPGLSQYVLADPRPGPKRSIIVHAYRPAFFNPQSPIVVLVTGRKRNAEEYLGHWKAESEKRGFLAVAPEFTQSQYPEPYEYNYGAMCGADGVPRPREEWLYSVIEAIFQDVRARAGSLRERYFLFGHSAGAQLVHRLVTFGWSPSIELAVAANSGTYAMPVRSENVPYGLGGVAYSDNDLRALFSRPMVVQLGDRDTDPNDEHLPREPEAMRQGSHRFARGHLYMGTALAEARRLGVRLAWRLAIAPGVAHSGEAMAPFAVRELFESPSRSPVTRE